MGEKVVDVFCKHEWLMRRPGGRLCVVCQQCPAQVRIDIFDTGPQWVINPVVTVAGRGVSVGDLDWLCDRVYELLHEVERASAIQAA